MHKHSVIRFPSELFAQFGLTNKLHVRSMQSLEPFNRFVREIPTFLSSRDSHYRALFVPLSDQFLQLLRPFAVPFSPFIVSSMGKETQFRISLEISILREEAVGVREITKKWMDPPLSRLDYWVSRSRQVIRAIGCSPCRSPCEMASETMQPCATRTAWEFPSILYVSI